jgi:hypothetical protein
VAVDLGREARILVPHDPLHRRQVGALHEQERSRRVAQVVEPKLPHLADREQLEVALRATPRVRVGRRLAVVAALAAALVDVAVTMPALRPRNGVPATGSGVPRPLEGPGISAHLDDDLAFRTRCFDVRHGLVGRLEWKDPIHDGAYGPRFDQRADLSRAARRLRRRA